MKADEFELERETGAPIDMLEHYFGAHGWAYERSGDDEIVRLNPDAENLVPAEGSADIAL